VRMLVCDVRVVIGRSVTGEATLLADVELASALLEAICLQHAVQFALMRLQ